MGPPSPWTRIFAAPDSAHAHFSSPGQQSQHPHRTCTMGVRLCKGTAPKAPRQPFCDGALGLYALTILSIVVVGLYPAEAGTASEMNLHANQGTAGSLSHAPPVVVRQASAHASPKSWTVRYSANSTYLSAHAHLLGAMLFSVRSDHAWPPALFAPFSLGQGTSQKISLRQLSCSSGYYEGTDTSGSPACLRCEAGTFSDTQGATSCTPCTPGTALAPGAHPCLPLLLRTSSTARRNPQLMRTLNWPYPPYYKTQRFCVRAEA